MIAKNFHNKKLPAVGLHLDPAESLVNSDCFWAYQSILTGFYNGGLLENIFGNINK